jgi:lysophospholipase L1-like esterase
VARRASRTSLLLAAVLALALTGLSLASPTALASSPAKPKPAKVARGYLALGDSVTFGFREATNTPTPDYNNAKSFVGYPEDVAAALHLKLTNASCPGETSASFIRTSAPSNGCTNTPGGSPGYRALHPLHTSYKTSQLDFAKSYLKTHTDTKLVTLMIGANDGFRCEETTADNCASEFSALIAQVTKNVGKILKTIRKKAHYDGEIVLLTYYSLNFADPLQNLASGVINNALTDAAKPYDVKVANGFAAFQAAAAQAGGSSCTAGLLTMLTGGGCGVHPSVAGQSVLAQAVEKAVKRQ